MAAQEDNNGQNLGLDGDYFGKELSPGAECFLEMLDNYDKPVPADCTTPIALCFDVLKIADELKIVDGCFRKNELQELAPSEALRKLKIVPEEETVEEKEPRGSSSMKNEESKEKEDRVKVIRGYLEDPNSDPSIFAHDDFDPELVLDYVEEQMQLGSTNAAAAGTVEKP